MDVAQCGFRHELGFRRVGQKAKASQAQLHPASNPSRLAYVGDRNNEVIHPAGISPLFTFGPENFIELRKVEMGQNAGRVVLDYW
jgi:hypothetical protein